LAKTLRPKPGRKRVVSCLHMTIMDMDDGAEEKGAFSISRIHRVPFQPQSSFCVTLREQYHGRDIELFISIMRESSQI
jgi:hypothetical protein